MTARGRAMAILFVILYLVMLGFGILIPVLPLYVRQFGGTGATFGALMATYSVMQLFFAPLWGRLSDRIGRRPVILVGLIGYGVTFILYGLSTQLWMLFAARALAGILSSATLPAAMAYVADVTPPEQRAKGMGILGAAIGMGIVTGPGVGGLAGEYSMQLPFFIAGGVALLNLPLAWRFLPESIDRSAPPVTTPAPRLSLSLLKHPLFPLFLTAGLITFTMTLFESTFVLFSADRFQLTAKDTGIMFFTLGIVGAGLQGGSLGKLAQRFGELPLMFGAMALSLVGFLALIVAWSLPTLWISMALFTLPSSMLRPLISTAVTRSAPEEKGALAGIQQSFDSLGRIAGPLTGGLLLDVHPSLPYALGALSLGLLMIYGRQRLPAASQLPAVTPPAA